MLHRATLKRAVHAFRDRIELCWSKETAYQTPGIQEYGPYQSIGQCAVTCLVLKDVLAECFSNEATMLVSGRIFSRDGSVLVSDHVWLTFVEEGSVIIIDPTIDQIKGVSERVFIGNEKELSEEGLRYVQKEIESGYGEREHPGRYQRYLILKNVYSSKSKGLN